VKPIRLKLAGLHSYREMQEIDFEKLCEAGLFGIFGPTGSGKSTILDAITLALYGQVVRFGGGNHPKEVLNQLEKRAFVSFTFELGKGEQRRRYAVEREFGLDKKGEKRQPEARLIQVGLQPGEPDVVLESKATAVTAAIQSMLGLTLQDFTRAVVLPQGQFSRFLTLKGSERNEMLQRMFQLHIYGEKLFERVRSAFEQVREEMHRLEIEMAALGEAGSEHLEAARQAWQEAAEKERLYAAQRLEWTEKLKQMQELHQRLEELQQVRARLQALAEKQEEVEGWKRKILAWKASIQIWPMLVRWERLHEDWMAAAHAMEKSRELQEQAQRAWEEADAAYQQAQGRLAAEEPELIQQKGRLEQAAEWEEELQVIREEWTRMEREWNELQTALAQTAEQLARDEDALRRWEEEWRQLDGQMQKTAVTPEQRAFVAAAREAKQLWERELHGMRELEAAQAAAEEQLRLASAQSEQHGAAWKESLNRLEEAKASLAALEGKPVMSDREWEEASNLLRDIKQYGRQWREQLHLLAQRREAAAKAEQERQQAQARCGEQEARWRTAANEHSRLQKEWEKLRQAWEHWQEQNMARYLRERLKEGQACPVCGSTHHVHAGSGHAEGKAGAQGKEGELLRQRLKAAEEAVREAEKRVQAEREALLKAQADLALAEQKLASRKDEQAAVEKNIEQIRQECEKRGESWRAASIEELIAAYQRAEKELADRQAEREEVKAQRERLQQQLELLREEEAELRRRHERGVVLAEQLQKRVAEGKERLEAALQRVQACADELERKRGTLAVEEIELRHEEIGRLDRQFAQLQRLRAEKEKQGGELLAACETARKSQSELQARAFALRDRLDERRQMWQQRHNQWLERTGGSPAQERIRQTEAALENLRQAVAEAEANRKSCAENRERLQQERVKHAEAYAVLTRERSEALEALQLALAQSGIGSVEALRELYAGREELEQAEERVRSHEQNMDQLRYDEQRLLQLIDGKSVSDEELSAVRRQWEECEQHFQQAQKQVAVAKEQVERVEKNHSRWLELQARMEELQDELSRLEELKKLFEAKAFVQFIAEEKLVSIARDASWHLMRMTGSRYALEVGDEGEFVLRDEAAGGMRRPVSTLSGGETFLTSLALALALSMEIQMRGSKLEFFFLDEGFGTLDPELLEVVMDALERLRMDDFTIGVISHVQEVRMRMPRRLIVTPAEPMGAGSRIHLELE